MSLEETNNKPQGRSLDPLQPTTAKPKILSPLQIEYATFFRTRLKLYGVTSLATLAHTQKSEFFIGIKRDWAKIKEAKKAAIESPDNKASSARRIPRAVVPTKVSGYPQGKFNLLSRTSGPRTNGIQIIKSEPNPRQTDDLRILYTPNNDFSQQGQYQYPLVKFPLSNSLVKLPREGRSNQKGYKENDFLEQIRTRVRQLDRIEVLDNVHMVIPHFSKPYEPDILLFDKELNLYIDIEIDEPYDGYYRFPTHNINSEDQAKKDNIRDQFFNDSGWIVIRFTEKQVHLQADGCIDYIENVLHSIYGRQYSNAVSCDIEDQWDEGQSIHWQKIYYREKYLGINHFGKQKAITEIEIDVNEEDSIENFIQRKPVFDDIVIKDDVAFDEQSHKYLHPGDQTGNAEFISVTTLIGRFFPFDITRYIEKKALEEKKTEEQILLQWERTLI